MADDWDEDTTATGLEELTRPAPAGARNATLTVLTGTSTGQAFRIEGKLTIGRTTEAEVRLMDDGISRQHARITYKDGVARLEDLASRNGTFVNGSRVTEAIALRDGDKVQVGRATVLRFALQDELDQSFHDNLLSSALRDGLTKLFNKRYFLDRLDGELKFALRHETALSVLMLDLDHFKKVNDTHGHLAGDAVLAAVSAALLRAVRNEDVVARFGGEELAIVLRAIGIEPALHMAERLRKVVEQTIVPFAGKELRATVSIGVAGFPSSPVKRVEQLVEAADQALYRAKHAGRNRVSR